MSLMYEVNGKKIPTWNPHPGCEHNCIYCYSPEIYRRYNKCDLCEAFVPHPHEGRLKHPPMFKPGETWFVESMGDFAFVPKAYKEWIIEILATHPKTTFYLQSKNPERAFLPPYIFHEFDVEFPDNVVLGTTIETNEYPRMFISEAPYPVFRKHALQQISHKRKYVTVEPILDFDLDVMIEWIKEIAPEFVYVGYLNPVWKAKKLQIPEPPLEKTEKLINELNEKVAEVRLKTMRKGWQEGKKR